MTMRVWSLSRTPNLLILLLLSAMSLRIHGNQNSTYRRRVLVGYAEPTASTFANTRMSTNQALQHVNAMAGMLTEEEIALLKQDSNVLYVEDDFLVELYGEVTPYGIPLIQDSTPLPGLSSRPGSCSDPNSFKIGIVDSGVDTTQPDLPCRNVGTSSANCVGASFGLSSSDVWNQPSDTHGTMVAGIIAAVGNNGEGVRGVLQSPACFIVARVFGSSVQNALLSDILNAVQWVADQGANVINLSLGGPDQSTTAQNVYNMLQQQGVLVVAASGNSGDSTYSYPASFDSVMSVAAVDQNSQRAVFSQYNSQVDIAAPGVQVLSTVPVSSGAVGTVSVGTAQAVVAITLQGSVEPSNNVGQLVECPNYGQATCPGPGGHICLIERGVITFEQKALNCQNSAAVGVVVYNNQDGNLEGTLSTPTSVNIPVVGITELDGSSLMTLVGQSATLGTSQGLSFADGTSFASPYVTGVAASIWQGCPSCTRLQVQTCMEQTAIDLGVSGRDDFFGNGLVQVRDSYDCLVQDLQCCSSSGGVPSVSPVEAASPVGFSTGCVAEQTAYQTCFETDLGLVLASQCRSCVNNAIPNILQNADCSDLDQTICPAIFDSCNCGSCGQPIENYLSCALNDESGCVLNCNRPTTTGDHFLTPDGCLPELQELQNCSSGLLSLSSADSISCDICALQSLPGSLTCSAVQNSVCPSLEQCGCETCSFEMEVYAQCLIDSQLDCNLDCGIAVTATSMGNNLSPSIPMMAIVVVLFYLIL